MSLVTGWMLANLFPEPIGYSHEQIGSAQRGGNGAEPTTSIADAAFVRAHSHHRIDVVLERFAHRGGLLPVVNLADVRRLEGAVTIDSMMRLAPRQSRTRESASPASL